MRIFFCIAFSFFMVFLYLDSQNDIMELRLSIPVVTRSINETRSKNKRLEYEIERFESPKNLIEMSRKPEFGHLSYPYVDDIIVVTEEEHLIMVEES
ncbi:MAG: hypothetical protein HN411_03540 [Waddliaceae bacterium]|nr:hypothetical protein [Waddliaceae bacterium]MBT3579578.1 hypothetical protein [Waddliaceae bacterium]MBT4444440.1 hypothetical protein [Waddliaceae bacterium]MBT6928185.1 hypothetical protein [Waddliaceae bacterium]MBT7264330.1 hypothetical protein [Waddliaceae bacterium]